MGNPEFTLTFDMVNDAFCDGNQRSEVRRILADIAERVQGGADEGFVTDINGNRIGSWCMEVESSDD